jgi:fatty-acyl-CoA synthase
MELLTETISACLEERVKKSPESLAIETGEQNYTWQELDRVSDFQAARFSGLGIKRGTHAAIWSTNTPNWIITFLALQKLGAVTILINTCYTKSELKGVLSFTDVETVFYGTGYREIVYQDYVDDLRKELAGTVRHWIPIGPRENGQWISGRDFSPEERDPDLIGRIREAGDETDPKDTAAILFTSGTTSMPKGVMLSHYNLINSSLETTEHMKWDSSDKMLIAVPMFHCFGITSSLLSSMHAGFSMHLIEYYRTRIVLETAEKYRCTLLNGVPSMFLAMIRNPEFGHYDISSLRRGIIAGSPITKEEYMQIRRAIPSLKLFSSYGQTETSPCVSIGDVEDTDEENAASAGRVIKNIEVRIAKAGNNEALPVGERGEILVKGYDVMKGYYNMPEETAKTIDCDGWLHTGDIGYLDGRNFLYVTGRLKELIIRGGENIAPLEIEQVIRKLDWVDNVKVVGVPNEVLMEDVAACIIPKPGMEIRKKELLDFVGTRLARYKVPAYVLEFHSFPANASGKIILNRLKEQAAGMVRDGNYIR